LADFLSNAGIEAVDVILTYVEQGRIAPSEAIDFLLSLKVDINETLLKRINENVLSDSIGGGLKNERDIKVFDVIVHVLTKKGEKRLVGIIMKLLQEIKPDLYEKDLTYLIWSLEKPLKVFELKEAIPWLREVLKIGIEKRNYEAVVRVIDILIKLGGIERSEAIQVHRIMLKEKMDLLEEVDYFTLKQLEELGYEPEDVEEKVFMLWWRLKDEEIIQMGTAALPVLWKFLKKEDVRAGKLIGEIGDKRAVPYLVEMLNKKSLEDWLRRGKLGEAFEIMRALHKLGWRPEEHWHKVLYFTALKDWNGLIYSCEELLPDDRKPLSLEDIYKSSDPNDALILRDIIIYCEVHKYEHNEENDPVRTFCYYEREKALAALFNLATSTKHKLPLKCLKTLTAFESNTPDLNWRCAGEKESYTFHFLAAIAAQSIKR
jgi:hypothetical protein